VLPEERDIRVHAAHDSITLTGKVGSTNGAAHALAVADAFKARPDQKIINLIEVAGVQQVMLEVRVAEMSGPSAGASGSILSRATMEASGPASSGTLEPSMISLAAGPQATWIQVL
jgi:pilus assembly protein CpaC